MAKRRNGAANGHTEPADEAEIDTVSEETLALASETLTGDLRDFMLDRLRYEQSKRPWHERSEADQRDTVHQVEAAVRNAVRQAVEIIAAGGLKTIKATIEQVTVKDGIKATLTMSKFDEHRHNLIDATGATVLVVVADPSDFSGEREPVEIKPDQPELIDEVQVIHSEAEGASPFH